MMGSIDAFPPQSEPIDQRFAVDEFFLLASNAVSDECRDVSSRLQCCPQLPSVPCQFGQISFTCESAIET